MVTLQSAKARLKVQEEELRSLHWEHEVLQQRFSQVCVNTIIFSTLHKAYSFSLLLIYLGVSNKRLKGILSEEIRFSWPLPNSFFWSENELLLWFPPPLGHSPT